MTPKSVVRRAAVKGLCPCTNHFRTPELAVAEARKACWRYESLLKSTEMPALGVSDVAKLLDSANQGPLTIQTMVFEPATLKLHVSIGQVPASSFALTTLDVGEMMKAGR